MKQNDWLVDKIQDLDDEAFIEVLDQTTSRAAHMEQQHQDGVVHLRDLEAELIEVRAERGRFKGFSTGYSTLDAKMGGLELGSVILVGGTTSQGKSALTLNMADNLAKTNTSVLYISLEMTRKQMLDRLDTISEGNPLDRNLMFQKSFRLTYKDLEPLLKRAKSEGAVEVVVLDYLQYLGRGMTLDEVARMSKEVKSLALQYNVAFVVIVSVRKGDSKFKRKWTDIEIEDFMGTAAIGYDCDTGILVSRLDPEGDFQPDQVYVKVLKTRNVGLDWNDRIVTLRWDRTRISEEWSVPPYSA